MGVPVIYKKGKFGRHIGPCGLCRELKTLITDHCHQHGLVRGSLCHRCNTRMRDHDRGHGPGTERCWLRKKHLTEDNVWHLVAECSWWERCRDCFMSQPGVQMALAMP